ncbi:MAG: cation diffusion facilitator family transporter [Lachnospiraceae bacterium]|jgi:cation diffusion facilitator family transporter|nr:cation diffusion facilitator family transporter [Lachnospiraceae bacterium]
MNTAEDRKMHIEKTALRLSFIGSLAFTVAELVMFFLTRSHAILMDCVFDSVELILIGPFLVLVPLLYKPVTEHHPYGYSQFESLFMVIKYGTLLIISIALVIQNVTEILHGGNEVEAGRIAEFEFVVFAGCLAMYLTLYYMSRKYASMIIRAELYMWRVDVLSSVGVALAFELTNLLHATKYGWVTPYLDPVIAIVMTFFLLVEPVKLIHENIQKMLLLAPPEDVMQEVRNIATSTLMDYGCELKFLDVIQTGRKTWVELYIDSGSSRLDLRELRQARNEIRTRLKGRFDQVYIELIPNLPDD